MLDQLKKYLRDIVTVQAKDIDVKDELSPTEKVLAMAVVQLASEKHDTTDPTTLQAEYRKQVARALRHIEGKRDTGVKRGEPGYNFVWRGNGRT